jgi:FAD/FMN-containing dehydrogenase
MRRASSVDEWSVHVQANASRDSRTLALVRCLWCYVPAVWAPRWLSWACSHCPLAVFVSFPLSRWPVFVPSAVRSIQIVRYARARGCKVKVVGSGHSFSHAAAVADDGIILDISGLSGVLGVDRARRRITVEAGMTVAVLCEEVWAQGWSLANIGVIKSQTIAGLLATASHGRCRPNVELP